MEMKKVSIILSCYNGEKYLLDQLNSIDNQTYDNITVYIHDDGSHDQTTTIINQFLQTDRKKQYILLNLDKLGYPKCFILPLLIIDSSDYYAFCDQDDVWYPNKIELAVSEIEKLDMTKPALYYSCVDYCNEELTYIRGPRFCEKSNVVFHYGLQQLLFGGEAMGMTYLFNEKTREVLKFVYDNGEGDLKDIFIKILCAAYENVAYSTVPSAKYRRHNEATTASLNPVKPYRRYLNIIKELYFGNVIFRDIRVSVKILNDNYMDELSKESQKLISLFSASKTIITQFKKVFLLKRYRLHFIDELGYRLAFLLWRM